MTVSFDKIRIDKWLYYARFFKNRKSANDMISKGRLYINDMNMRKSSNMVRIGDILIFPKADYLRLIEVKFLPENRKSAVIAKTFYNDLDPPMPKGLNDKIINAQRERGSGRPTKKQRRETDKLKNFI